MIAYFSGTGNSLYVARHLADELGETLMPMTLPSSIQDEVVGLVFPVYAWGIPNVVERFVRSDAFRAIPKECYLYAVMTCGDDMGYADRVLEGAMGRNLDAAFSVLMPNVYVCLPGFDVDDKEVCREKFVKEEATVKGIAAYVSERRAVHLLRRGCFPRTKTYVIRPLFNRFLVTDRYFRVDATKCVSCGRCRKMCPVGNILLVTIDGEREAEPREMPQWQSRCTGCLACYHACPYHAINYGRMTQRKGQYRFPPIAGGG